MTDPTLTEDGQGPQGGEGAPPAGRRHSRRLHAAPIRHRVSGRTVGALAGFFALVVLLETRVYVFMKGHRVPITGDEPHYLILARTLGHFHILVGPEYEADFRTHHFFPWPANATLRSSSHGYFGPHGLVSFHGLGVSALIAPFIVLGGTNLALTGFFAIEAVGLIYLHQRASRLAGLTPRGQAVFAVALAGPALWIAGTQLYPDLITGIFLACALVEVAVAERDRRLGWPRLAVFTAAIAFVPWLHIKNVAPGAMACVALAAVGWRAGVAATRLLIAGAVIAGSWILLFGYNQYFFGHLLGLPQPAPAVSKPALAQALGLLLDSHQGLLVQMPTVVLGLAGVWFAARQLPVAVIGAVGAAVVVIALNGSYTSVPYGGGSLAGRFEWTAVPLLLMWCPWLISRFQGSVARSGGLVAAIAALWVAQSVPIVEGHHVYFNSSNITTPWDPSTYPGWWSRFNVLLVQAASPGRILGRPWFAVLTEGALVLGAFLVALRLGRRRRFDGRVFGVGLVVVAAAATGLTSIVPLPLPAQPRHYTGADLGAPLVAGAAAIPGPRLPLQGVGAGTFKVTLIYAVSPTFAPATGPTPGPAVKAPAADLVVSCTPGTATSAAPTVAVRHQALTPGSSPAVAVLRCPHGTVFAQLSSGPDTHLDVQSLTLAKTAN